jgi:hypothetical protein
MSESDEQPEQPVAQDPAVTHPRPAAEMSSGDSEGNSETKTTSDKHDAGPEIDLLGGAGDADARGAETNAGNPGNRKRKSQSDQSDSQHNLTQINNTFNGAVHAEGGTFGARSGGAGHSGAGKVTGKLTAEEIADVVGGYAAPLCFEEAVHRLRTERIVVLEGQPGLGRRAGAIALLSAAEAKPLIRLSPSLTLKQLAERDYNKGCGYLVVDRMSERNSNEADFTWSSIRDQVIEDEAYLIVTTTASVRGVPHFNWTRPSDEDVLKAQLIGHKWDADNAGLRAKSIAGMLPKEVSLEGLAAVAAKVANGEEQDAALASLRDNAADEVRNWFAEKPDQRRILEVTALCFLEHIDVRTFETALDLLRASIAKRLPAKYAKALGKPLDGKLATRAERAGLMQVKENPARVGTASVVVFADDGYRRCVLAELWRIQDNTFWDAVAEWLDAIVWNTDGVSLSIASGIAWLACSAFEEVNRLYLDPWSFRTHGVQGQLTAIYALWYMCRREGLAPVALQVAADWADDRDIDRRWSAVVAFSGDLGIISPADAVNQLWRQLTANTNDLWVPSRDAIAQLFATLTYDQPSDARVVLTLLEPKMRKYGLGIGAERMRADQLMRMRTLTMEASLAVIEITSFETGRPAIIDYLTQYLREDPDRLDVVARLWAGVLCHRPHRDRAMRALRRSLQVLQDVSDEPREDARRIGAALARALPVREHQPFKREFNTVNQRLNRGQRGLSAEVLLACLEAISQTMPGGTA